MSQEDKKIKKYKVYIRPIYVDGLDHQDALLQASNYCTYFGELLEFSNVMEVELL